MVMLLGGLPIQSSHIAAAHQLSAFTVVIANQQGVSLTCYMTKEVDTSPLQLTLQYACEG